jgi:hypothetical protein
MTGHEAPRRRHASLGGRQLLFDRTTSLRVRAGFRPADAGTPLAASLTFQELHMTDPQPVGGRKSPPRAEPLQPDNPATGDSSGSGSSDAHTDEAAEKEAARTKDAIDNVSTGYR